MMDDASQRGPVRGRVKWFDLGRGFGFIAADEGGPDILLHVKVLRAFGQFSVPDGSVIWVEVDERAVCAAIAGVDTLRVTAVEDSEVVLVDVR